MFLLCRSALCTRCGPRFGACRRGSGRRCGIFQQARVDSRVAYDGLVEVRTPLALRRWPRSCFARERRITMWRFPVLAVVLTLGVGPNTAALCRAWCAGDDLEACHGQLTSPPAIAGDCCDGPASLTMVLSGDTRQGVAHVNAQPAAPSYHFAASPSASHLGKGHEPRGWYDTRLATVLRI